MNSAAELWTKARELLAAFTHVWGEARKIALQWTMIDAHVIEALKALGPVEALARRLVFAEALTMKLKPPQPKRIVVKAPKHVSPFTIIPLDPLAFRRSLEPRAFIHLRPPHELEAPPENWRVRFCVARFAEVRRADGAQRNPPRSKSTKDGRLRCASSAWREFSFSRGWSIRMALARRERRLLAREAREHAAFWAAPDAPRPSPEPAWRLPQRISTEMLARRAEAVRRVIEAPTRYARALARRMAKHPITQVRHVMRRLRQRFDVPCQQAMDLIDAALPAFADTS